MNNKELELAKRLAYKNLENENTEIGFDFNDIWITNPFLDSTGRFEFKSIYAMYDYYGKENVDKFLKELLED